MSALLRSLRVLVVGCLAGALPVAAQMGDGSATYSDSWPSDSGVYGWGSTSGSESSHDYAVEVSITSPNGRVVQNETAYQTGSVSNSVLMSWDSADVGEYTVVSRHKVYCRVWVLYFAIATLIVRPQVELRYTTYSNPVFVPDYPGELGTCQYTSVQCQGACQYSPPLWYLGRRLRASPISLNSSFVLFTVHLRVVFRQSVYRLRTRATVHETVLS